MKLKNIKHYLRSDFKKMDQFIIEVGLNPDDFEVSEANPKQALIPELLIEYKPIDGYYIHFNYLNGLELFEYRHIPSEYDNTRTKGKVKEKGPRLSNTVTVLKAWLKMVKREDEVKDEPRSIIKEDQVYYAEVIEEFESKEPDRPITDEQRNNLLYLFERFEAKLDLLIHQYPEEVKTFKTKIEKTKENIKLPNLTIREVGGFIKDLFKDGLKEYILNPEFRNQINGFIGEFFRGLLLEK